jgi:tRNA A37 threonylcarbamoyladenosine biosynthesis protein TsaE
MNETVYKVATLEETREFANKWLNDLILQFKDKNSAVVVGLSGHLGAGKTAFTKIIAELIGIQPLEPLADRRGLRLASS